MKSPVRLVAVVAGVLAIAAGGILIGSARRTDPAASAALHDRIAAATARGERLQAERDRLRAERNQLEARLATGGGSGVCPDDWVTTGDLLPWFTVDYPCGWHAVFDPTVRGDPGEQEGPPHVLLLSRLPISLAPGPGPVADLELAEWSSGDGGDDLATRLASERAALRVIEQDDRFEGGDGITVHRLRGRQEVYGEEALVHVLLWTYEDAFTGGDHVVRAHGVAPGRRAAAALERLGRSFRIRRPG